MERLRLALGAESRLSLESGGADGTNRAQPDLLWNPQMHLEPNDQHPLLKSGCKSLAIVVFSETVRGLRTRR